MFDKDSVDLSLNNQKVRPIIGQLSYRLRFTLYADIAHLTNKIYTGT